MTRRAAVPRTVAVLVAVLLIAAGVIAGREALAAGSLLGLRPADAWLPGLLDAVDGRAIDRGAAGIGSGLVVLGLLLLWAAWHRDAADVVLGDTATVRLRPQDVARLASATAADVDGVLAVTSTASRRSVLVRVSGTGTPELATEVRNTVGDRLSELRPQPRLRVQVATREGDAG
jgi:hypothetical protein